MLRWGLRPTATCAIKGARLFGMPAHDDYEHFQQCLECPTLRVLANVPAWVCPNGIEVTENDELPCCVLAFDCQQRVSGRMANRDCKPRSRMTSSIISLVRPYGLVADRSHPS